VLEEAWLIRELIEGHGLALAGVAQRLCRSVSWASRRLALVRVVPAAVEEAVQRGQVAPQAAMKSLVPLARANKKQCECLVVNVGKERLSVRQFARLYAAWRAADRSGREKIVAEPLRFLEVDDALSDPEPAEDEPDRVLLKDLGTIAGLCRRARTALTQRSRRLPWPSVLRFAWQETQAAFSAVVETVTELERRA
jgi:hypothetical protein